MVAKLFRSRTSIAIGAALALVALISAGVVFAQVQRPGQPFGPMGGRMGGPGMRQNGPMGPMGPGMGPGMGPLAGLRMAFRRLGITDAQKEDIRKILETHKVQIQELADKAIPARRAVGDAIESGNEGAIREASASLAAIMTDGAVLRSKIQGEVFGVLTPEQKTKAKELRTQAEQRIDHFRAMRKNGPIF